MSYSEMALAVLLTCFTGCASMSDRELVDYVQRPQIQDWIRAAADNPGWPGPEARKANHNRVRIMGVLVDPNVVLLAAPRYAATIDSPGGDFDRGSDGSGADAQPAAAGLLGGRR